MEQDPSRDLVLILVEDYFYRQDCVLVARRSR